MFPQLVELKSGETYNGHMVLCDSWMNIHLREVICTSKVGNGRPRAAAPCAPVQGLLQDACGGLRMAFCTAFARWGWGWAGASMLQAERVRRRVLHAWASETRSSGGAAPVAVDGRLNCARWPACFQLC